MVENWMKLRMFASDQKCNENAEKIAKFFRDASVHLSHGRRISREEAKAQGVIIEELEKIQTYKRQYYQHIILLL